MSARNNFNEQCITYSQMNMIFNSRIFWRRLTTWIRAYIISRFMGIGTGEEAFKRLNAEISGIGNMLQITFERENSNRLSQLLNQFTYALQDLITSAIQRNNDAINQNVKRLYKTADDIAEFLPSINPYLIQTEWKDMMEKFVSYIIEEINSIITGDSLKDIEFFDSLTDLTNKMGDIFAQGFYDYITSGLQIANNIPPQSNQQCITYEQMNQIYSIRMFWFELFTWLRAYMLSRYRGLGNADEMKARLEQVLIEYVNALKQIFGEKVEPYLQILNNYIDLINALITAQKEGNTNEIYRITQLLYQNADQRAAFITSLNPYWDQSEWTRRLYNNLRITVDESTTFLSGDYSRNLDIFDTLLDLAENTSGYFARGLFNYISSQNIEKAVCHLLNTGNR